MKRVVVEGSQWGDEGKGKITDYLSGKAEVVVRFQGGNNAGHTIVFDGKKFALRLLPSGIFHKGVTCVLASGMVISPSGFFEEVEALQNIGIDTSRIKVSDRASVLLDYHKTLDGANESALAGSGKIGTTGRGIGPCYTDKASRVGLRICDLLNEKTLKRCLERALIFKNRELESYGLPKVEFDKLYAECLEYGKKLKPYVTDTSVLLQNEIKKGTKILFEGAQGAMLCLTHGTYPFVTSSSPMSVSIPLSCGIPPKSVEYVLGIAKAYTTRVGEGPFPTELFGDFADELRERGHEYGTVTKRPRRIGWLDINVLNHCARISGVDGWALTLLDVLDGVDEIKICTGYELNGEIINTIPATLEDYAACKPVYITMPGWSEDITTVKSLEELPLNAQNYLKKIEELTGVPIAMFSVGPDREQTVILHDPFEE